MLKFIDEVKFNSVNIETLVYYLIIYFMDCDLGLSKNTFKLVINIDLF